MSTPSCGNASPAGGGRTCFGMRAAQAAASSGVARGFAGGAGFATGAANFVGASGAFCSVAAGFAAGAAGASRGSAGALINYWIEAESETLSP